MTVQDLINKKDYDYISWRITHPEFLEGVLASSCRSKNGKLIAIDYDCYSPNEEVLRYKEWSSITSGINHGLTVVITGKIKE